MVANIKNKAVIVGVHNTKFSKDSGVSELSLAAQAVRVEPGAARGDLISVTGDLNAGDKVIIRGAERLQPGQQVQVAAAGSSPAPAPGAN